MYILWRVCIAHIIPYPVIYVFSFFHAFEAGIVDAIPCLNDEKQLYETRHLQYWNIGLLYIGHPPEAILSNLMLFLSI